MWLFHGMIAWEWQPAPFFGKAHLTLAAEAKATPKSPEAAEFFEKQVRPVLAENCFACHGEAMQMAGLRLDSPAALLKGRDSGRVILVPGDPDNSPLIQAIRYTGPIKMPPPGKLPEKSIEALTQWVRMGAPWPQGEHEQAVQKLAAGWKKHWAFQPVSHPVIPEVKNKAWVQSPVDAFVLAKLEEKGLAPSKPTDRRRLIRRATFDLIGLPPSPEEVAAFASDESPEAFAGLVDRLLGSPSFGERWGRHWLDVARYGETKGYTTVGLPEELRYPFAYTYRDWVVKAFNDDMPYDQFLIQQIAADFLARGDDKRGLAAMGFLTLGRRFANNVHLIVDDRLDVVFRGMQGLTIGCARCHDHKYDPIPTKDYYSLYGVLAGGEEKTVGLLVGPADAPRYQAYEEERQTRDKRTKDFLEAKRGEMLPRFRRQVGPYLLAAHAAQMLQQPEKGADLNQVMVERWRAYLEETRKEFHPVFAPWHAFAGLAAEDFASQAPALAKEFAANGKMNPQVAQLFAQTPPTSLRDVAERYGSLFTEVDKRQEKAASPTADAAEEQLRQVLFAEGSPTNIPLEASGPGKQGVEVFLDEHSKGELNTLKRSLLRWSLSPTAPAHALVLVDLPTQQNPRVFLRGKPDNLGEEVPRHFLGVLAGPNREPFKIGSGRLELALAIASKSNPLTARVMVNRIWLWLFGTALVRTPSDFGLRSEPPTHSELLDYLAHYLVENGWSVKKLIRLIVVSSVYQQSSDDNAQYRLIDPENRLLWKMNRRRFDFEAMRDSVLSMSGQLDTTMGGPAADLTERPFSRRRTVYGLIDRDNLPGMFRAFDFPSPETHSPQRSYTTVPQQPLFLMNSPFVIEQARELARRSERECHGQMAERIQRLYRLLYQRPASPEEVALGLRFIRNSRVEGQEQRSKAEVWRHGYGPYDETSKRVKSFTPLPYWTGESWQGGEDLPDPKLGQAMLGAEEGHPGPDLEHAVIRRWVAPRDGTVMILGTLKAPPVFAVAAILGDGVQGRIVSSRWGELGSWVVYNSFAETNIERVEVKRGDTIDFIVDCRKNPNYDSFAWAPTIRAVSDAGAGKGSRDLSEWSAANDFSGPAEKPPEPLLAWEKYTQVLLMANEFVFVD